jgi:hypothetical protein
MEQLEGAERLILQTILDSPKDSADFVEDTQIATASKTRLEDVQNSLEILEGKGFVDRAMITDGFSAYVTAKGRNVLRLTSTDRESRISGGLQTASKVVPKGLRSYDKDDAGFFLDLLPPPRHPDDGLPHWF